MYLRMIAEPTKKKRTLINEFVKGKTLMIYDARPKLNAMANRIHGKGTENIEIYTNCNLVFLDIENI